MNTKDFIKAIHAIDIKSNRAAEQFEKVCSEYTDDIKKTNQALKDKYDFNLAENLGEDAEVQAMIGAELLLAYKNNSLKLDLDKINLLFQLNAMKTENKQPVAVQNIVMIATFYAMSLQSYLFDAEGGIISIDANLQFARNWDADHKFAMLHQNLINTLDDYGKMKRYGFFEKANKSEAIGAMTLIEKMKFFENYLSFITNNDVDIFALSNNVYKDPSNGLKDQYDHLIEKEEKEYNRLCQNAKAKNPDIGMYDLKRFWSQITDKRTTSELELIAKVDDLTHKEQIFEKAVENRIYPDNTQRIREDFVKIASTLIANLPDKSVLKQSIEKNIPEVSSNSEMNKSKSTNKLMGNG